MQPELRFWVRNRPFLSFFQFIRLRYSQNTFMTPLFRCLMSLLRNIDSKTRRVFVVYSIVLTSTSLLDAYILLIFGRRLQDAGNLLISNNADLLVLLILAGVLISKSLLALLITAVGSRIFANAESRLSAQQLTQLLSIPWVEAATLKVGDFTRRVDYGPQYAFQFLLMMASLLAEASVIFVSVSAYVTFDPVIGSAVLLYFSLILLLQVVVLNRRMNRLGNRIAVSTTEVHSQLAEMSQLAKSLRINKHASLIKRFSAQRLDLARLRNFGDLLQNSPRYLFEVVVAIGFGVIAVPNILLRDSDNALRSGAFFAVVLFRVAPSLLRVQALILALVGRVPLIGDLDLTAPTTEQDTKSHNPPKSNSSLIELQDVAFRHSREAPWLIRGLSLQICRGNFYAITGPSGSGKTTLLDLIVALRDPSEGSIRRCQDLQLSYLPQDTLLLSGGLVQNVSMNWNSSDIDYRLVIESLKTARLEDLASVIEQGQNPLIQSNLSMSGGQRQRIGIARALYARPSLLVLDEPSSAVDQDTTHMMMQNLRKLDDPPSVVMVTHDESLLAYFDYQIELQISDTPGEFRIQTCVRDDSHSDAS